MYAIFYVLIILNYFHTLKYAKKLTMCCIHSSDSCHNGNSSSSTQTLTNFVIFYVLHFCLNFFLLFPLFIVGSNISYARWAVQATYKNKLIYAYTPIFLSGKDRVKKIYNFKHMDSSRSYHITDRASEINSISDFVQCILSNMQKRGKKSVMLFERKHLRCEKGKS